MNMTDPLPRTSEKIVLRRLSTTDLRAFQAYRHDPDVARLQGWVPTSDEDAQDFLAQMGAARLLLPGIWCQIGIADCDTNELIGDIGLNLASDSLNAEIGFTLRRQSQGLGLATAAVQEAIRLVFETTPAEKVVAITDALNGPSIRLLERTGMRRVETRSTTFRGEPCTEHVYAIVNWNVG